MDEAPLLLLNKTTIADFMEPIHCNLSLSSAMNYPLSFARSACAWSSVTPFSELAT